MVHHTALGSGGAGTGTWIHTFLTDAFITSITVCVEDTLGATPNLRVAEIPRATLALVMVHKTTAESISTTWVRHTGVIRWSRWLGYDHQGLWGSGCLPRDRDDWWFLDGSLSVSNGWKWSWGLRSGCGGLRSGCRSGCRDRSKCTAGEGVPRVASRTATEWVVVDDPALCLDATGALAWVDTVVVEAGQQWGTLRVYYTLRSTSRRSAQEPGLTGTHGMMVDLTTNGIGSTRVTSTRSARWLWGHFRYREKCANH